MFNFRLRGTMSTNKAWQTPKNLLVLMSVAMTIGFATWMAHTRNSRIFGLYGGVCTADTKRADLCVSIACIAGYWCCDNRLFTLGVWAVLFDFYYVCWLSLLRNIKTIPVIAVV